MNKVINISGIGRVKLEKSCKAKSISITLGPGKNIRVAVPRRGSFRSAIAFVKEKEKWIKKNAVVVKAIELKRKEFSKEYSFICKEECCSIIKRRVEILSRRLGINFKALNFREQKTMWGSCSSDNKLSLNIKLAFLPPRLMDYIIIHELLHVKYKSHGKRFNRELSRLSGDIASLDRELKEYQYLL